MIDGAGESFQWRIHQHGAGTGKLAVAGDGIIAAGGTLPLPCMNAEHGLTFEHIGPEDASAPPFAVAVGQPGQSTEQRFYVTPAGMRLICALIWRYGATRPSADALPGTFAVSGGDAVVTVPPEGMRVVLRTLRRLYEEAQVAAPAMLAIQETLLYRTRR